MSTLKSKRAKKPRPTGKAPGSSSSAQSSSSKKAQVYDTVNVGLDFVANLSEASDVLAPLKAACRATKSILDVKQAIDSNKEDLNDLIARLEGYMSSIEKQVDLFERYSPEERIVEEAFSQPFIRYVKFLEDLSAKVLNYVEKRSQTTRGRATQVRKVKIDAETIRRFSREVDDRHRQFMEALNIFTTLRIQSIERSTKDTKVNVEKSLTDNDATAILQLPMVAFVPSSIHNTCMQGTREAVLQMIWHWASDDISDKPIFWLCDIAGSGKSTVAMSAAERWRNEGILGGRFFFSIASSEGSTTEKFCSTIARELAYYIPGHGRSIADAVRRNPIVMRSSLDEQFRTLITGSLHSQQDRVIFVIDALDECKSGSQRKELVEALYTAVRECKNLKIFMTSRPDPVVEAILGSLSTKAKLEDRLHHVNHRDNIDDIANYVHRSLGGILPGDKRQKLVEKANGLFIWASTACRMLKNEASLISPEDMYARLTSMDQVGVIDDVYNLVFERTDPEYYTVLCTMLALLAAAFEPLTIDDLDDLLKSSKIHGSAKALVHNLGSVLTIDATNLIQFRHPTVVEYLRRCPINPAINNRNIISINFANAHGQTALWCLKRLKSPSEGLKFNICQIESSFNLNRQIPDLDTRVSNFISRRLRYASSHWVFHVAETNDNWRYTFSSELEHITQIPYVLYWMEILSFTGGVPRAIAGLRAIAHHAGLKENIKGSIIEIRRFMMAFSVPIQDSAPHIYLSALPFAPIESKIHNGCIEKFSSTLTVTLGVEKMFSGLPKFLRGHEDWVRAVGFSPDGSKIVSGSSDRTIRLWDVDTGQALGKPLRGHSGSVRAVGFLPDGSRIVSGSSDKTIRLWDVETGQALGKPFRGHESSVLAVRFLSDGSRIVSGSRDKTIRLWDADTGLSLGQPLRGHEGSVRALGISPDGSQIASGSSDKTIRLWDADTGLPLGEPLWGHQCPVLAVEFSPDGSRIVSGSSDKTIRIWDADTGQTLGEPFCGHEFPVLAVGFSPDGSRVVSGSSDKTIRLWDVDTGQLSREPLRGHEYSVLAVVFSPDGSQIVSGSRDKTIRLWDVDSGQPLGESLRGHEGSVLAVRFSSDGSKIVSSSRDQTVRLWDVGSGQPLGEPIRGHADLVRAVGFSLDGSKIVSGSSDKTIRLWDIATRTSLGAPFPVDEYSVLAVGFLPDGSRIICGSSDGIIQLWDADTGQALGKPLRVHSGSVRAVGFSPDGSKIVSGSSGRRIQLWDVNTGNPLGEPVWRHNGSVLAVGFSPDGSRIVSGSADKTIQLWEADTGQPIGEPLRGHEGPVYAVGFSSDGLKLVSGSSDQTIRLWDVNTGQALGEPYRGHQGSVYAVEFSPDSSRIVSGSSDKTIRLWDVHTIPPLGAPLRGHEYSALATRLPPDGSQIVSHVRDKTVQPSAAKADVKVNKHSRGRSESPHSRSQEDPGGLPLRVFVPGFQHCSLLQDGWVQSSGKFLFWTPPENRHGLLYPHLLTMPTTSPFRATKLDFTQFRCGPSWTSVRKDP